MSEHKQEEPEVEPEDAEHQPQDVEDAPDEEPQPGECKVPGKERKRARQDRKRGERCAAARAAREVEEAGPGGIPASLRDHVVRLDVNRLLIKRGGLAKAMNDALLFANDNLLPQMFEEFANRSGFLPALQQLANVASIPGIVGRSIGMPDAHSGYGFAIGNVAAVNADDPHAVVCPGGVGYDINCGVRLIRTDLTAADLEHQDMRDKLADELFRRIPVGVGSRGDISFDKRGLDDLLTRGLGWAVDNHLAWPEDVDCCEEGGRIAWADASKVSKRAKARGLSQVGTLGSGNHYVEVQVVDEVFDTAAAEAMGINQIGRVCIMIHSGSRGMGHQICTDALQQMQSLGTQNPNDRQLTGVPIQSQAGRDYLAAMGAGANYAFVNRSVMTHHARNALESVFGRKARDMNAMLVYDVCHNIAKLEDHVVEGKPMHLLVHRKGATRAFAPGHPMIPEKYRSVGQPVIIGGSMGTSSYVLTGTAAAMENTFGSTCHGAGRSLSRSAALRDMTSKGVMASMRQKNITVRISTPKLIAEEAAEAYKDVSQVVQTCHDAGISKLCVRLRPIIVVKG